MSDPRKEAVIGPIPEWAICHQCYWDYTLTPGLCECGPPVRVGAARRARVIRVRALA